MPAWDVVYDKDGIRLVRGDSRQYLPTLPDGFVTLVLSDPPY